MSNTIVHMLRHAQVHNPEKMVYERLPDFHLSAKGVDMADAMSKFVQCHKSLSSIECVISSPLERAIETAHPTVKRLKLPLLLDERLLESKNYFAGIKISGIVTDIVKNGHLKYMTNPFKPSWGETYLDISLRMTSIIEEVKNKYKNQQILLVSHQLPIFIARRTYEKKHLWHNPRRRACALASLTSLVFDSATDDLLKIVYRTPVA
ncbi:MAG: phosphoglycerate mutase family protein [Candidatus Ancillula trichonymphae]|nr:phosphoglycerate mutase family protein [Candidatus Ancillula trichonymphae]